MTKKLFETVATVLKAQQGTMATEAFTALTKAFADKFAAQNPAFKPALFFKAAGWVEVKAAGNGVANGYKVVERGGEFDVATKGRVVATFVHREDADAYTFAHEGSR